MRWTGRGFRRDRRRRRGGPAGRAPTRTRGRRRWACCGSRNRTPRAGGGRCRTRCAALYATRLRRGRERGGRRRGRLAGGATTAARAGGAGLRAGRRRRTPRRRRRLVAPAVRRVVPGRGADRRLLPRGGVPVGGRVRPLRPRQRPRETVGDALVPAAQGGPCRRRAGGTAQGRRRRGVRAGRRLYRRAARPDALRRVSRARPADRLGPGPRRPARPSSAGA